MSIASRIFLAFFFVAIGGFYLLLDKIIDRIERQYFEATEDTLVDTANALAGLVSQGDLEMVRGGFANGLERELNAKVYNKLKSDVDVEVYITDAKGVVTYDSDGGALEGQDLSEYNDVLKTLDGRYGARSSRKDESDYRSSVLHVAAPVLSPDGEIEGVLTVRKPQAAVFSFIAETRSQTIWLGAMILTAILASAFLLLRWLSRPIRRLTDYAHAVERGERVTLPKLGHSEMARLGKAFEGMRDALEGRKYAETYVQTLTHEMKSPIAAIRGASELLRDDEAMPPAQRARFLANIEAETQRLQNRIERLLALSAIEGRKHLETRTDVDIAGLVRDVIESHRAAIDAKKLKIEKAVADELCVGGEHFVLEMALANLLQNAIDFSPVEGVIRISAERKNDRIDIQISDEGAGIPEYAIERVFERFYSLKHPDTGRKSSGLGLCFVKEAAELHGGSTAIRNRESGGAEVTLSLPAL